MLLCAVLAIGCGSVNVAEETEEQTQLLSCSANTCRGSVTNGSTPLPSENTYLCAPIMMSGSGAHSQSPLMSWGVPAWGAAHSITASASSPSMAAIPNSGHQGSPKQGQAVIETQCDRWTNFTSGATNGYSGTFLKMWNWQGTLTPQYVSDTHLLWDLNSVCWLNSLNSFYYGERAWLDVPNGWNWNLNVHGYKELGAGARCAWLGSVPDWPNSVWLDATTGAPQDSMIPINSGRCFTYNVEGNLDDGYWIHSRASGTWALEVSGGVTRAWAYCVWY
jgi:hypothetical protein